MFIANGKTGGMRLKAAGFGDDSDRQRLHERPDRVGAVDANAVAMMVGGIQFRSSISAAIHSQRYAHGAIGVAGSPRTIAGAGDRACSSRIWSGFAASSTQAGRSGARAATALATSVSAGRRRT